MSEPTPGAGSITIELDGKEVTLVPSFDCAWRIANAPGGVAALVAKLSNFEASAYEELLTAALGLNPVLAKKLPKAIYETGMMALQGPLIRFCRILLNGGREPDDEDQNTGEDPPEPGLESGTTSES